jgi:hypothetical protein
LCYSEWCVEDAQAADDPKTEEALEEDVVEGSSVEEDVAVGSSVEGGWMLHIPI